MWFIRFTTNGYTVVVKQETAKKPTYCNLVVPSVFNQGVSEKFKHDMNELGIGVYYKNPRKLSDLIGSYKQKQEMDKISGIV